MAYFIKKFDTTSNYNSYMSGEHLTPNVCLTNDDYVVHFNKYVDYSKEYLTFEALESGTFTLKVPATVDSSKMTSVSYSTDNGTTWTDTTIDSTVQTITTPAISQGDKVLWKGTGTVFGSTFSSTGSFNVEGNIMSLLYGDNFVNQTTLSGEKVFNSLFKDCVLCISAAHLILPATTLTKQCYANMFDTCILLTSIPATLPATTLALGCYAGMFTRCRDLQTIPSNFLPATTMQTSCYYNMFGTCGSLTTVPSDLLPATTLATQCYNDMFINCTSLTTAPALPATTLAQRCYNGMFNGCSSLNSITMLATNISATNCLQNWVNNVAASGTFTKAASMTTLPSGNNGIPANWTVVNI